MVYAEGRVGNAEKPRDRGKAPRILRKTLLLPSAKSLTRPRLFSAEVNEKPKAENDVSSEQKSISFARDNSPGKNWQDVPPKNAPLLASFDQRLRRWKGSSLPSPWNAT